MTKEVNPGFVKIKPHHVEGAMHYIKYGGEHPKFENWREMFELIQNAARDGVDIVLIEGADPICKGCIADIDQPSDEGCPETEERLQLEHEVADAHGWEFHRPYESRDFLSRIEAEASERKYFNICPLEPAEHLRWIADVSKAWSHWLD